MAKKVMLNFSDGKEDLHLQLKSWCAKSKQTVNGTVLELINNFLVKNNVK